MTRSAEPERVHLLHVEASAREFDLFGDPQGFVLEAEAYVTAEREVERVGSLTDVLDRLRQTQLPFCDVTWLVDEPDRPDGHERFETDVAELVEQYREAASQLQFTM